MWTPRMVVGKPTNTYFSQGKPLGYYIVGWIFQFTRYLPMIGCNMRGRVHWKSSATKVVRSSTTLALGGLH